MLIQNHIDGHISQQNLDGPTTSAVLCCSLMQRSMPVMRKCVLGIGDGLISCFGSAIRRNHPCRKLP
eukprot:6188080-Pleurochrysis_carterae.AAC.2